jgi:hypothetical protein
VVIPALARICRKIRKGEIDEWNDKLRYNKQANYLELTMHRYFKSIEFSVPLKESLKL